MFYFILCLCAISCFFTWLCCKEFYDNKLKDQKAQWWHDIQEENRQLKEENHRFVDWANKVESAVQKANEILSNQRITPNKNCALYGGIDECGNHKCDATSRKIVDGNIVTMFDMPTPPTFEKNEKPKDTQKK